MAGFEPRVIENHSPVADRVEKLRAELEAAEQERAERDAREHARAEERAAERARVEAERVARVDEIERDLVTLATATVLVDPAWRDRYAARRFLQTLNA